MVAAAVAPPFLPTSLSGLTLWLDAADGATITSSSSNVSQWNDKSGSSRNFTQPTGANQPVVGTPGGHAGLTFNGTSSYMLRAEALSDFISTSAFWCAFVVNYTAFGTNNADGFDNQAVFMDNAGNWGVIARSVPNAGLYVSSAGVHLDTVTVAASTDYVLLCAYDGVNLRVSVNGGAVTTLACGSSSTGATTVFLGSNYANAQFHNGVIREVIMTNTTQTAGNETSMINSLRTKWGTA